MIGGKITVILVYVLFFLVDKKSSLTVILCEQLNGIGNLADDIDRSDTNEGINGVGRKLGRGKTKRGASKEK